MPDMDLTNIISLVEDLTPIAQELTNTIERLTSAQEAFMKLLLERPLDGCALYLNVKHQVELEMQFGELARANSLKMIDILEELRKIKDGK